MLRHRTISVVLIALTFAGGAAVATAAPAAGDPVARALTYVESQRDRLGLVASDLADVLVTDRYESRHNGITHVYLRQRHAGIPVVNANINVNVGRDGRIINLGGGFVPSLAQTAGEARPGLDAEAAVVAAAGHLGLAPGGRLSEVARHGGPAPEHRFAADPVLSLDEIPSRLTWYWTRPLAGRDVRLAWEVTLRLPDHKNWWVLWVDALDGRLLGRDNLVDSDSYEVYAIPAMSPDEAGRTVQTDVADPTGSPFGWHDTNGAAGAEFTDTRGNNVFAQEDRDANNTGGFRPNGGAGLDFLFPLDLALDPIDYQPAAITNLFYWNNVIHDVFYRYGFDEPAGNFQENNYGKGGAASDPVQADAQDGSGLNNANFSTPPDGSDPRMQMFEWVFPFPNLVDVHEGGAAGTYTASGAAFGPDFTLSGVSGDLVLAIDTGGLNVNDGCEALTNGGDISGNIAVIDRGNCNFVLKVRNAQNVGARAVVVINNVPGPPITMGDDGSGGDIVIPSAMISQADGALIEPTLPVAGTARSAGTDTPPNRDSDLDNGVIVHEYTHGLSNRLTGGPGNVFCLNNQEQAGEGWSDWYALALTAKATDTPEQPRGIGTYVVFQPTDGIGIRTAPYSTDMAINPWTYDTIKTAAIPHGVGAVWAQMIWEVYWNLVTAHGFDADIYTGNGGNNLALQLVTDGLKLQPCSPHFVNARDAILSADMALTGGANQCLIWKGFAKRGLGLSANAGSAFSVTDGTQAFDLPAGCEGPILSPPAPGVAGVENCYQVTAAAPNVELALVLGRNPGEFTPPGCTVPIGISDPHLRATGVADAAGEAELCTAIPPRASGFTVLAQVVDRTTPGCTVSNVNVTTYE